MLVNPFVSLSAMTHPLSSSYSLYYTDDNKSCRNYEDRIHEISEPITTAECLVQHLSHLKALSLSGTDYHLFVSSIKPMWEDPANRQGGKFIVRTKRGGQTMAVFNMMVFALSGGTFAEDLDICGVVARCRGVGSSVCLWHRNREDVEIRRKINHKLIEILKVEDKAFQFEYERHDGSM
jgi:translation initiation factor 4E